MIKEDVPQKLRPFVAMGFNYDHGKVAGDEAYGNCLLCGSETKFYINIDSGLWSCKAGACSRGGNITKFMAEWYEIRKGEKVPKNIWDYLVADRKIPIVDLRKAGLVYEPTEKVWYLPIKSKMNKVISLRKFKVGGQFRNLPEIDVNLYGAEEFRSTVEDTTVIFLCEGEWDVIATRRMVEEEGLDAIVIGVPGASVWKDKWTDFLERKNVVIVYDNDDAGTKGKSIVYKKVRNKVASFKHVVWSEGLPDGFDMRDFMASGGTYDDLTVMIEKYSSPEKEEVVEDDPNKPPAKKSIKDRPPFSKVLKTFRGHLHMSEDMENAIRVIFAVSLTTSIGGDPLWVHIVSPPGTAKTELLLPLSACASCYFTSTISPKSLVSGFIGAGGTDPSLIPKLNGKTFVLKDWTEILNMPKISRDEVYAILRGAYDGEVHRSYANNVVRDYRVRFNMVTGVTHAIFGERSASMGERFLIFHLVKGVGQNASEAIRAAIKNVGKEKQIRHELNDIVRDFLYVDIDESTLPDIPDEFIDRIIALSGLVAMLRASVEKTYVSGSEKITYRPQHEMGTRLGKQLTKLAYGLSLINDPPSLGEKEYEIVSKVALDTCVGYNLETISYLADSGGHAIDEMSHTLDIPVSTLRDQMQDLEMLGVVKKERVRNEFGIGAPKYLYYVSDIVKKYWVEAGLTNSRVVEKVVSDAPDLKLIRTTRNIISSS